MICLYLDILIIGHELCNLLFYILNEIKFQKEWQHLMTNNVLHKNIKLQPQDNKKAKTKILARLGNQIQDLWQVSRCITTQPLETTKCTDLVYLTVKSKFVGHTFSTVDRFL